MRALFVCTDRPTIARNRFHRACLESRFNYDAAVSQGRGYLTRIPAVLMKMLFKMWRADFLFIGYMGHFVVPFARLFTRKPIVFDFYLSLYDVLCNDRKIFQPDSPAGRFTYRLERRALELADFVVVDTETMIRDLSREYGVSASKFVKVHLTIDESQVFPKEVSPSDPDRFTVLYVGSYIPLHGTPVIVEAARILQERGRDDIRFVMIGRGPDYDTCRERATRYGLRNIDFKGFMPLAELNDYYNACDINLGLFNDGVRANNVVLNKTNDSFRVGKPHLTLATEAMREAFRDNEDIFFVPDIRPETLASRLAELADNPELVQQVGRNALAAYGTKLSNDHACAILDEKVFSKLAHILNKGPSTCN